MGYLESTATIYVGLIGGLAMNNEIMKCLKDQVKQSENCREIIKVPYIFIPKVGLVLSLNFEPIIANLCLLTNKSKTEILELLNFKLSSKRYFEVKGSQIINIANAKIK